MSTKRTYTKKDTEPKEVLDKPKATLYNKISLTSQFSAHITLEGHVTGQRYVWKRSGDAIEVDERDAPSLLEKKIGERFCCGGKPNFILKITGQ